MKLRDMFQFTRSALLAAPYAALIAVALPIAIVVETFKNQGKRRRAAKEERQRKMAGG